MYTSRELDEGSVYTRHELRAKYNITDASLNNGIFHPRGHDSIWLFVTETKSADRTQYADLLEGDTLQWDGQSSGRNDLVIMEHEARGLELLLFYRHSRTEYAGSGFQYEGRFRYVSHSGSMPMYFVLQRVDDVAHIVAQDVDAMRAEESYREGGQTSTFPCHDARRSPCHATLSDWAYTW